MVMIRRILRHFLRSWQPIAAGLAAAMLCAASPAHAAVVQEFRIVGVGVEDNSTKAQDLALDYAKKRAVYLAARKLGVANASEVVAKFTPTQYSEIIRGTNITQTRRKQEITYLEVHVTLLEVPLRRALKLPEGEKMVEATATPPLRGVLLLTVYVSPERAYMWEKGNQLRAPMADEIRRHAHGGVLLPGADLEDLRLVDYQNALTVKGEELKPMFERYGAEEIIIAVLTPSSVGSMTPSSILLRRLTLKGNRNELLEVPPAVPEETSAIRLARSAEAIAAAVTQIASSTAERDEAARRTAKKMPVTFLYSVPKDFARMQDAMRQSPEVLSLDLPSIGLARVSGTLYVKGDVETLRAALVKQGIIVTPHLGGWQVSVR